MGIIRFHVDGSREEIDCCAHNTHDAVAAARECTTMYLQMCASVGTPYCESSCGSNFFFQGSFECDHGKNKNSVLRKAVLPVQKVLPDSGRAGMLCPIIGNTLTTAFLRDQNQTIPFGLIAPALGMKLKRG